MFWYSAGATVKSPFGPLGLLAFEFFAMHWVEVRRWQDLRNPGSVDQDPIFTNNKLPPHEVGPAGTDGKGSRWAWHPRNGGRELLLVAAARERVAV